MVREVVMESVMVEIPRNFVRRRNKSERGVRQWGHWVLFCKSLELKGRALGLSKAQLVFCLLCT